MQRLARLVVPAARHLKAFRMYSEEAVQRDQMEFDVCIVGVFVSVSHAIRQSSFEIKPPEQFHWGPPVRVPGNPAVRCQRSVAGPALPAVFVEQLQPY